MQKWADYLTETMGPVIATLPDPYEENQQKRMSSPQVRTHEADPIGEYEYTLLVQKLQESKMHHTWDAPDQDTLNTALAIAAIALMRDGLIPPNQTASLCWSDLKKQADGSGLLTIRHSKKERPGTDHVTYVSPRTMQTLDETRRIRQKLTKDTQDNRIFDMTKAALNERIKDACHAAELTGNFTGYSPSNGMIHDLTRSGVSVNELRTAKGWNRKPATHSALEDLN